MMKMPAVTNQRHAQAESYNRFLMAISFTAFLIIFTLCTIGLKHQPVSCQQYQNYKAATLLIPVTPPQEQINSVSCNNVN